MVDKAPIAGQAIAGLLGGIRPSQQSLEPGLQNTGGRGVLDRFGNTLERMYGDLSGESARIRDQNMHELIERNQEPIYNREGRRIPVVQIDLFPTEEQKGAVEEELKQEQVSDDDEQMPLLQEAQQPEIVQTPAGPASRRPPFTREELQAENIRHQQEELRIRNVREAMDQQMQRNEQFEQEVENLLRHENAPQEEEERNRFRNFINALFNRAVQIGYRWEIITRSAALIWDIYNHWREKKLPPIPPTDNNVDRQKWFDDNGIPPQCRRRLYADSNGILRSVVICDSLENQRIYHDK